MRADFKSGFVTLIGRPNVGKSTLMNYLIGQKIAITSNKPQTTRNRIQTVLTTDEGQIVFVDTPGLHKAKNKLGTYMVNVADAPVTNGVAKEVPLTTVTPPPTAVVLTFTPGATRSGFVLSSCQVYPLPEKDA